MCACLCAFARACGLLQAYAALERERGKGRSQVTSNTLQHILASHGLHIPHAAGMYLHETVRVHAYMCVCVLVHACVLACVCACVLLRGNSDR